MKNILIVAGLCLGCYFFLQSQNSLESDINQQVVQADNNSDASASYEVLEMQDSLKDNETLQATKKSQQPQISSVFGEPLGQSDIDSNKYSNYFSQVIPGNMILRWPKTNLTYYVEPSAARRLNISKLRRALSHWQKKSKIFTFRPVTQKGAEDIYISLATTEIKEAMGEAGADQHIAGSIYTVDGRTLQERIILHASLVISEEYFTFDRVQQYQQSGKDYGFVTLVHEMGHVLGLNGHSPNRGDCMYFQADRNGTACDYITADVNTLAMLYGQRNSLSRGFYEPSY